MIAVKYILFAIISTVVNLLFQYFSLLLYHQSFHLYVAMFVGTLAGLICKYILDKKFIFYHTPKTTAQDAKKFIGYSFTGVFTTIIFWSSEIAFDYFFDFNNAMYIGAIVGLSLGYIIKYQLDKKYVFNQ